MSTDMAVWELQKKVRELERRLEALEGSESGTKLRVREVKPMEWHPSPEDVPDDE